MINCFQFCFIFAFNFNLRYYIKGMIAALLHPLPRDNDLGAAEVKSSIAPALGRLSSIKRATKIIAAASGVSGGKNQNQPATVGGGPAHHEQAVSAGEGARAYTRPLFQLNVSTFRGIHWVASVRQRHKRLRLS
jgi:hypothetical protein